MHSTGKRMKGLISPVVAGLLLAATAHAALPTATPLSVNLNVTRLEQVSNELRALVADGAIPGASFLVRK